MKPSPFRIKFAVPVRQLCLVAVCGLVTLGIYAQKVITVPAGRGDMTTAIQSAIDQARQYGGKPVVIRLENADYHLHRASATPRVYYASNTTSEAENPVPTKHIALWLKGLRHVTLDGQGARLVTHGEMTAFVVDSCQDVTLRRFTLTAADPTVPEMTVMATDSTGMTVRIHPSSDYRVEEGRLRFEGESWTLAAGIAQIYDPGRDITWRSWSPLATAHRAAGTGLRTVRLDYGKRPDAEPGQVFQMRDGIRDEVCGLVQYSRDVVLEDLHLAFLGNFGIVSQMSENLTFRHLTMEPEPGSGRTCAGFADFMQFSGCKGRVVVDHCRFSGSQDDPINIHGTHLAVTGFASPRQLTLRYMHPQTYGFQSFCAGDEVELVDPHSLLPAARFKVREARMASPREIVLTADRPLPDSLRVAGRWVAENVTCTPEVTICHNFFTHIPTRGILVTTRRKVLIEDNTFHRTQMSALLIADDARSWYESGPVHDVTIRGNRFIECAEPVICIWPENDVDRGCVHRNIRIKNNCFRLRGTDGAVRAKSVAGLTVRGNCFQAADTLDLGRLVRTEACRDVTVADNWLDSLP